jgi:serine/threonine-protein kinase
MFVGRRLFDAESEAELLMQVTNWIAPRPSVLLPGVPAPIAEVVTRALAHDPNARFESARALSVALEEAAFEERIGVSQNGVQEFMEARFPGRELTHETLAVDDDKTVQRLRSSVVLPQRSLASVLPVTMGSSSQPRPRAASASETPLTVASSSRPMPDSGRGRGLRIMLMLLGVVAAGGLGVSAALYHHSSANDGSELPSPRAASRPAPASKPAAAPAVASGTSAPAMRSPVAEMEPADQVVAASTESEPEPSDKQAVEEPEPEPKVKTRSSERKRRSSRRKKRRSKSAKTIIKPKSSSTWDPNSALPPP